MKGVYVLIIQLNKDMAISVGALGTLAFKKDLYAYVGSAQTNMEQRIRRHLRREKRIFWHIDYLLNSGAARIVKMFHKQADKAEECAIAKALDERGESIDGFGCSDCNCTSHLFRLGGGYGFLEDNMEVLDLDGLRV